MKLSHLFESSAQLKGYVGIHTDYDAEFFLKIWAFRTEAAAREFMLHGDKPDEDDIANMRESSVDPDAFDLNEDVYEVQVEMGELIKPWLVVWTDGDVPRDMKFVGVGKTKEDVEEDAEEWMKFNGTKSEWLVWIPLS